MWWLVESFVTLAPLSHIMTKTIFPKKDYCSVVTVLTENEYQELKTQGHSRKDTSHFLYQKETDVNLFCMRLTISCAFE